MTAAPVSQPLPDRLPFLDERAKARAVAAVKAFELQTSAELVVTVKKQVRSYPEADFGFGSLFAFVILAFLLFYPVDFSTELMPVDVALAFAVGFGLSRYLPPMRKLALSVSARRVPVEHAAKAAFYDLGISRTTGRTGVLVFVSLFEGMVAIVCDEGVTAEARKAAEDARSLLETALKKSNMNAFAETLEALGPRFAPTMARAADDVNELPDDVA